MPFLRDHQSCPHLSCLAKLMCLLLVWKNFPFPRFLLENIAPDTITQFFLKNSTQDRVLTKNCLKIICSSTQLTFYPRTKTVHWRNMYLPHPPPPPAPVLAWGQRVRWRTLRHTPWRSRRTRARDIREEAVPSITRPFMKIYGIRFLSGLGAEQLFWGLLSVWQCDLHPFLALPAVYFFPSPV